MKIIIAEDHPASKHVLERTLLGWDFDVTSYEDGGKAWRALQDMDAPDIAILDWEMPIMNGLELIGKIRSKDEMRSMYIIMLTMKDDTKDVMDSYETGVDDFLSKPVIVKELRICVEKGKRMVRMGKSYDDRQENIMENIYAFMEERGRLSSRA
jgi:DNA-binding response OmpR family regulator